MEKKLYNKLLKATYFERMSTVYARHCRGRVGLMTADVKKIPLDGIWHLTERIELMKEKANKWEQVDVVSELSHGREYEPKLIAFIAQIEVMDEKGENVQIMWKRPANGRPVSEGYQPDYPGGAYIHQDRTGVKKIKSRDTQLVKIRGDSTYRD
jgi:hypothetical protein